jgi:hypothetical protein
VTLTTTAAALLTLVRAYGGGVVFYDGDAGVKNSEFGDWSVLDARGTDYAAVITVNADSISGDTVPDGQGSYGVQGAFSELHELAITVAVKRGQGLGADAATENALTTLTDALRAFLVTYQRLNNAANVRRALIVRTSLPYPITESTDTPGTHRAQDIIVRVVCDTLPTFVETG